MMSLRQGCSCLFVSCVCMCVCVCTVCEQGRAGRHWAYRKEMVKGQHPFHVAKWRKGCWDYIPARHLITFAQTTFALFLCVTTECRNSSNECLWRLYTPCLFCLAYEASPWKILHFSKSADAPFYLVRMQHTKDMIPIPDSFYTIIYILAPAFSLIQFIFLVTSQNKIIKKTTVFWDVYKCKILQMQSTCR